MTCGDWMNRSDVEDSVAGTGPLLHGTIESIWQSNQVLPVCRPRQPRCLAVRRSDRQTVEIVRRCSICGMQGSPPWLAGERLLTCAEEGILEPCSSRPPCALIEENGKPLKVVPRVDCGNQRLPGRDTGRLIA